MAVIRIVFFLGFVILATLFFVMMDHWFHLGMTSKEGTNTFISPFIMIWAVIIFIPSLRKIFFNWFILDKKKSFRSICFPILVSILMAFLLNLYRLVPYWLGFKPVDIGSNQITTIKDVTELGLLMGTSILGPFTEEFLFRYLMFAEAPRLLAEFPKEREWVVRIEQHFQKRKRIYWVCWILIVNISFGIAHGPNLLNFPLYFIPGLIFTFFFLRYGFLAAWLSHGMFNFFSGIALHIILKLFY